VQAAHRQRALAIGESRVLTAAKPNVLPPGFRSSLLEGLSPSEVKAVLGASRQRRISAREVVQHDQEPSSHLFLLVTGRAAAYQFTGEGGKLFLRWLVPGDAFGLLTVQQGSSLLLWTVQAVHEGSVLVWNRDSARALVLRYPRLRENVYTTLTQHVASLINVLGARSGQTAEQRLARMLVESARQIGRAGNEGVGFDLTNEQLADMANVSLFTASRQLSEWQRQGILKKSRGKIRLCSPERLASQHF
jgi:CRP-like cAMP-binding protein